MKKAMMNCKSRLACGLGLIALLAACATGKPPTAQLAVSQSAIDEATSAGAAEYAPVELTSARDKLMRANSAVSRQDYKVAEQLATEAEADARLAQSKASSVRAQKSAEAVQENIRVLREELNRKSQ